MAEVDFCFCFFDNILPAGYCNSSASGIWINNKTVYFKMLRELALQTIVFLCVIMHWPKKPMYASHGLKKTPNTLAGVHWSSFTFSRWFQAGFTAQHWAAQPVKTTSSPLPLLLLESAMNKRFFIFLPVLPSVNSLARILCRAPMHIAPVMLLAENYGQLGDSY